MTSTQETTGLAIDEAAADVLFRDAHTTYTFSSEPVSDEQLHAIYDLMRWAPTAMNSQPLRIYFLRDEAKDRLIPLLAEGNRAKSESAPVVAILAYDADFHHHLPRVLPQNPAAKDGFADDAARADFARFQATIQVGYFILAARAAGLDAGPMAGFDRAGVDAEFLAGTQNHSLVVVNLGHAAEGGQFPRNPRLESHEVILRH